MADSLERTMRARIRLIRDDVDFYDQNFYDPDVTYTESTHQRIILATNMENPSEVDMGGVANAVTLFLQTDRAIKVALVANTRVWEVGENGAVMIQSTTAFTHLYLQNESTTNQATVELVVTD